MLRFSLVPIHGLVLKSRGVTCHLISLLFQKDLFCTVKVNGKREGIVDYAVIVKARLAFAGVGSFFFILMLCGFSRMAASP